jgi:hypothetical protein
MLDMQGKKGHAVHFAPNPVIANILVIAACNLHDLLHNQPRG